MRLAQRYQTWRADRCKTSKIVAEHAARFAGCCLTPVHIPPNPCRPRRHQVAAPGDKMRRLDAQQDDIVAIASVGMRRPAGGVASSGTRPGPTSMTSSLPVRLIPVSMDRPQTRHVGDEVARTRRPPRRRSAN